MNNTKTPLRVAAWLTGLSMAISVSTPAVAETAVEAEMINLIIESRFQKAAESASAEERASAQEELENIFVISDLPRAAELAKEPRLSAQLELSRRAMLFQAFANDFVASNPATDQEIFNLYEEQIALAPPKEYKARHILVETQGEAATIIDELKAGANFEELAKVRSTGPSGPSGGDLGWFTAQSMVKPFSDAVAEMEDGDISSEPVQSQFGWHVILREDSRDSTPPPLESVRDVIKQRAEQNKFQDYMRSLKTEPTD